MLRRVLACLALGAALTTTTPNVRADDTAGVGPLRWDPAWSHAGPADYSLTGLGVTDTVVYEIFFQSKQPALYWNSPILFDNAVRDALRGSTPGIRSGAETASWGLLGLVIAYPFFDAVYAWKRYGRTVAWDLFWQDATVLSLATAVDLNYRDLIGRARPPVSACLSSGGSVDQCVGTSAESTRSFPGGHMLMVTSAAALTCTQHLYMHLYGAPWDAIACATAVTGAAAVGTLRIVADDHWASDILVGGVLGTAFGWGIPVLMHLNGHSASSGGLAAHLAPIAIPVNRGGGAGVAGWF